MYSSLHSSFSYKLELRRYVWAEEGDAAAVRDLLTLPAPPTVVRPAKCCPARHRDTIFTSFLELLASHDVASKTV
jgi:hypothetical protein